jgi:uncharacterized protein (TIGR02466 family)
MVELFPIKIYKTSIVPSIEMDCLLETTLTNLFDKCDENKWAGESGFSTGQLSMNLHHLEEFRWLFTEAGVHLEKYWEELEYASFPVTLRDSWANLHYGNHETQEHSHTDGEFGNSIISAVYYFRKPNNVGNIVFCNPLDYILRLQPYKKLKGIETLGEELSTNQYDLLLFPSWLRHRVPKYNSSEKRIAISFNYCRDL